MFSQAEKKSASPVNLSELEVRSLSSRPRDIDPRPVTHGPPKNVLKAQKNVWYPGSYRPEDLVYVEEKIVPLITDFKGYIERKETAMQMFIESFADGPQFTSDVIQKHVDDIREQLALDAEVEKLSLEDYLYKMEQESVGGESKLKINHTLEVMNVIKNQLLNLLEVLDIPRPTQEKESEGARSERTPWRTSFYHILLSAVSFAINGKFIRDKELLALLQKTRPIWDVRIPDQRDQLEGDGAKDEVHVEKRRFTDPREVELARYVIWSVFTSMEIPQANVVAELSSQPEVLK